MPARPRVPPILGRASDLDAIDAALRASRLVTVVGPPGVGKTRLAVASAERSREAGVAVLSVGLGGVRSPEDADERVALEVAKRAGSSGAVLGKRDVFGVPAWASALGALGPLLLVLDGCEGALDSASYVAETAVESSEDACVLASSREALGVIDEHVHVLAPLPVPPAGASVAALERSHAVAILRRGAREKDDLTLLAEIARGVDGLPVALERCADLLATLSPRQLVERLQGLSLASALAATLESSWEPLDHDHRAALMTASLFDDAFTLEAFERACLPEVRARAPGLLAELSEKSLVSAERVGPDRALRMLAVLRSFVLARLEADPSAAMIVGAFDAGLLARAEALSASPDERLPLDLVALVERGLVGRAAPEHWQPGLVALAKILRYRGDQARLSTLLERALADGAPTGRIGVELRVHLARSFADRLRLADAAREAERALDAAHASGDPSAPFGALLMVADVRARSGRVDAAREALELSRALADRLGDGALRLDHASLRINLEWRTGSADAAWQAAVAALAEAHRAGVELRASAFRLMVAQSATVVGTPEEVARLAEQVADEARALGAPQLVIGACTTLGLACARDGHLERAEALLSQALSLAEREGSPRAEVWGAAYLGVVEHLRRGELERLEAAALRVDLEEPLLLLIPLFAALAGSAMGRYQLDEGLRRVRAGYRGSPLLDAFEQAADAATNGRLDALREAALRLPPAFRPDLMLCERLMAPALRRSESSPVRLTIAEDGSWFVVPTGERFELRASPTTQKLLLCLCAAHRAPDRAPLSLEDLRNAAWPGDRSRKDAAANRVYVALNRLRDRGLRDVIVREPRGWRLGDEVEVVVASG